MSTRVHELAKELGLKSQDLIDRFQSWGIDVKPSPFAGLAPEQIDRIRSLAGGPGGSAPPPAPVAQPSPRPASLPPSETSTIRASAPAVKRPTTPPAPVSAPTEATPPAPIAGASPTATAPAPKAPARSEPAPMTATREPDTTAPAAPTSPPAVATPPAAPAHPAPTAPAAATSPAAVAPAASPLASPPQRPANTGPAQAPSRPGSPPPSPQAGPGPGAAAPVRPGNLTAPPRLGGGSGPLSRHTPHRTGPGGPATGSAPGPRPGSPQGGSPERPPMPPRADYRPNPTGPAPLKPTDYISPTGARAPLNRTAGPAQGEGRQPLAEPRGDYGPRSVGQQPGGPRRPLPPVATPSGSPQPRRPDGPRPGPGGPEVKTQRPERRFTPDEMRRMMQGGQIGNAESPAPMQARGPGGAPSRPGQPPSSQFGRPPAPARPGGPLGPGGPPGLRRPSGPGTLAPPPMMPVPSDEEEKKAAGRIGSPADRAGRRAKRNERANERRTTGPQPASALTGESEDDGRGGRRGGRKGGHKGGRHQPQIARKTHAEIEPPITLRGLSEAIGIRANDLIRRLMNSMGQMITINASLDDETAQMLALEFGVELDVVHERTAEDDLLDDYESSSARGEEVEGLAPRPPVITILGHVDHGKTSLLDKIRNANVVDSETGGITQHIGAYQVTQDGQTITFVDTPGHEAFTAMRARGANVTDIVVLVVAADDGVMPQTQEAIAHAKAAGVPIVVALNKIDLPNVNLNKIFGELSQQDLAPEEYGGDTPVVKTSALSGKGIPELLEMLGVVAELRCDLRSNPNRPATGTCLEASISEGRGVVATVLVQDGTLKVGDAMVCGDGFGRVRALFDDKGRSVPEAGPSMPVEVSGLDSVPTAGEKFGVVSDISRARDIVDIRRDRTRGVSLGERQSITLENLYTKMAEQKVKNLNLILKADVQGSLEALIKELEKLENPEVPIRILLKGVGGISESDILLADASQAIVIGFRVAPEDRAISLADEKKIDIRRYDIIYQVTDEIKKAVEGMLVPEIKEVHLGRAVVRQTFKISKTGTVAGCFVTQGVIERAAKARIIREGREIYKGSLEALKRFKDDAKEVREGFECGIKITNFDDLKVDDIIEAYRVDVIRRTL